MRFLVDTNVLIAFVNHDKAEHEAVDALFSKWATSGVPWCLGWNIVYEFLRVSTHPRVFRRPLTAAEAERFIFALIESPDVSVLVPTERHAEIHRQTVRELGRPHGNFFHDVHTAVLMREHGVSDIVTMDRDFRRFPFLRVVDPLAKK